MLRLLGILSLGHLLLGGHHHRRALRRGLLLGALFGWLASRDGGADRAAEDIRRTVRETKRTVHDAVHAAKREIHQAKREIHEARREEHRREIDERLEEIRRRAEARRAARETQREYRETAPVHTVRALPECDTKEAKAIRDLAEDLERDARTAAMAADVPTIDFPEEDGEKYFASRKHGYA